MENRVLVIIDNIIQYDRIKNLILLKKYKDVEFEYRHSVVKSEIWDHVDFKGKNKSISVVSDIDWIISNFNLVLSVHCLQFFPKQLVQAVRCINVHPGYNPINRGWYPQVFAIINNLQIGATIHEMDEKLDNGPIIGRKFVEKYDWDTSLTIYNRVLETEIELLEEYIDQIIDKSYKTILPESKGNFYSKKDFNNLCEIDLNQNGTYRDFYNHLRALTHGNYLNAYFIEEKTKEKIYIKIEIIHE